MLLWECVRGRDGEGSGDSVWVCLCGERAPILRRGESVERLQGKCLGLEYIPGRGIGGRSVWLG